MLPDLANPTAAAPLFLAIALFGLFALIYTLVSPRFETEKQRAYVLSSFSSATMTSVSLPFLWNYAMYGLGGSYVAAQAGWLRKLGVFGVVFFGTYLTGESL